MTLDELRRELHNTCMEVGGIAAWAVSQGISFGYVSSVIRGDAKPGKKILKAMGKRKAFSLKKSSEMKFEDVN